MEADGAERQPGASKRRKLIGWVTDHVAGTLVGLLVTALATAGVAYVVGRDQSTGQKIDQIFASLEEEGLEVREKRKVQLHAGATSYLFAVGRKGRFEPDELRIYDDEGGSLKESFSFAPTIESRDPSVSAVPADFTVLRVADLREDGRPELLGSYDSISPLGKVRLPVSIVWHPAQGKYELAPLLPEPPRATGSSANLADTPLAPFESPYVVSSGDGAFTAWAAESLTLLDRPLYFARGKPLYLGTAYPPADAEAPQALAGKRLDVAYWGVGTDVESGVPSVVRLCWTVDERLGELEVGTGEEPEDAIERGWNSLAAADERSRRGETSPSEVFNVGGVGPEGQCIFGE